MGPRHFGTACELEGLGPDVAASGVSGHGSDPGPGFQWTLLQRHGRRPLAVLSRKLLEANNRCAGLPYWSELSIHETAGCRFAASLRHAVPEAAGHAWCDAWLCDSADAVRLMFCSHDPLVALPSFPSQCCFLSGQASFDTVNPDSLYDALWRDDRDTQRFRGAWAGLLAAVFGLPAAHKATK